MRKILFLILYYFILRYLPCSYFPIVGGISRKLRYICCKRIFMSCGKDVNIERMVSFGKGNNISIGDRSGFGVNCNVPSNITLGCDVMMVPIFFFLITISLIVWIFL